MRMRSVPAALGTILLTSWAGQLLAPPPAEAMAENCRQFAQNVTIDGQSELAYGVECQQPDGTWAIVQPPAVTPPYAGSPGYTYEWPYWYPDVYPWAYPWYFGPRVPLGVHPGWGGLRGGGWQGGGWRGQGGRRPGGVHHAPPPGGRHPGGGRSAGGGNHDRRQRHQ